MREPGPPHLLAVGAHVIQDGHRGDRVGAILVQHHAQPVVELVHLVVDLEIGTGYTADDEGGDDE